MKKILPVILLGILFLSVSSCGKEDPPNDNNQLDAPELLTPSNNSSEDLNSPFSSNAEVDFDWTDVSDADEYLIEIASDQNFSTIYESFVTDQSRYFGSLLNNTSQVVTYYWRVKAIAPDKNNSDFSSVFVVNVNPSSGGGGGGNVCDICKSYQGSLNGSVSSQGATETFNNTSLQILYNDQNSGNVYQTTFSFPLPSSGGFGTSFTIDGELSGNTITYTNEVWNFEGTAIILNGSATFNSSFTQVNGSFTLSGGGSGNVSYFGND